MLPADNANCIATLAPRSTREKDKKDGTGLEQVGKRASFYSHVEDLTRGGRDRYSAEIVKSVANNKSNQITCNTNGDNNNDSKASNQRYREIQNAVTGRGRTRRGERCMMLESGASLQTCLSYVRPQGSTLRD